MTQPLTLTLTGTEIAEAHPHDTFKGYWLTATFRMDKTPDLQAMPARARELTAGPLDATVAAWQANDEHLSRAARLKEQAVAETAQRLQARADMAQAVAAVQAAMLAGDDPAPAEEAVNDARTRAVRHGARIEQLERLAAQERSASLDTLRAALTTRQEALRAELQAARDEAAAAVAAAVAAAFPALNVAECALRMANDPGAVFDRVKQAEATLTN